MIEPLRVLIVEDEAVVLMQLEELLEDTGHEIVGTAMTADEAIAMTRELHPELVLLDVHLKDGTSGVDVARAVRDINGVMVVFLTANVRKLGNDMDGAAAAIAKPFNEAGLAGSIAYLEECVHRPPPLLDLPVGMLLAPDYLARMEDLRASL